MAGNSLAISVMEIEGDQSHRWICTGSSVDGGPLVPGTNYTFINIQASHTIAFNWQEQYHLTVVSSVGSTTGTGWYNIGTTAIASVSSDTIASGTGTRQVFTGWAGDATGTDVTSNSVIMDGAKTATASWKAQYQVIYATSGSALDVIVPPTEWIDSAAPPTGAFPTSTTNSVGNAKVVFVRDNRPIAVNGPITITGIYQTQYLVTFNQSGVTYRGLGTIVTILNETKLYEQLASSIWVNRGNSVAFRFAETVESADVGSHFALARTNATSPLTVNEPTTIHADYELQTSFTLNTILISAVVLSVPPLVAIPALVLRRGKRRITPIAIGGGLISPGTTQKIERGGDSTVFIIAANPGYRIADVVVDNTTHLGAVRTYKFFNVNENHTISAIFYKDQHQTRVVPATQTPAKRNF